MVLAIGAIALPLVLRAMGWAGIHRALGIGVWFVAIAAADLASALCDAFAVHGFLRPHAPIPYLAVFAAQASGIAINRLTPGNSLGEPVKVTMLVHDVPVADAVAAIVKFNLTTLFAGIVAIVVGVAITALLIDLPHDVAVAMWIGVAVIVVAAFGLGALIRRGALGTPIDGLARVRIISAATAERWRARTVEIDVQVRAITRPGSGLARGLAGVLASRVCNGVGTFLVLYAAGIPLTAPLVIASLSVGILITWMSNVIPLGLGLSDGGNYLLYALLGASPDSGLVFAMVNRLRTCVLAGMGLVVMAIASLTRRRRAARAA